MKTRKMTTHKFITALTAIMFACPFQAPAQQQLEQEITVEHEVVPERRDVSRLNFMPAATLPAVKTVPLAYSTRNVQITVPGTINTLQPAAFADTLAVSPYRGYAALGIFPLYNLGATAGYKLIDNDHTRLAAFLQYDGSLYKGHIGNSESDRQYVRNNTGLLDITLHQAVGAKSFIDAGVEAEIAHYNMPGQLMNMAPQNMHHIAAEATWLSHFRQIDYEIGLHYGNFGFGNTIFTEFSQRNLMRPVTENNFGIDLKGHKSFRHYSTIGAEINFNCITNSEHSTIAFERFPNEYSFHHIGKFNHALLRLYPYYRFDIRKFRIDLGARLDFTFNSGKTVHVAPRALVSWKPSKMLTIFANAGGGEHQNSLRDLYGVTPYAQTFLAYGNSHIPITLNAGITCGTFHGFYAKASAGYARANKWLMPVSISAAMNYGTQSDFTSPVIIRYINTLTVFKPVDMRGTYWRVEAGYTNRMIEVSAAYQGAGQGYDKGYYYWRDRAKGELEAKMRLTPIKPLDISLSYKWRHGRAMINRETCFEADQTITATQFLSLGAVQDLSAGGAYRYTDRLTFFVTFNNLLNRRHYIPGLVEAQGINGLIGATYKF